ncbi:MAG: hypothetical protein ABW046_05690 [Actinoplanes sp.]
MNVVADMLLTEPAPVAIWVVLMLLSFPAMLVLGSPEGLRNPWQALREALGLLREHGEERWEEALQADRAETFAEEVTVAADQATEAAGRWQESWEQAETRMAVAFEAWLDADARLRTGLAAAAYGLPWTAPTCAEYAGRERHLHRVVRVAVEQGRLPAAASADAEAGRGGWDARLHALEQELVVRRASARYLRERYEAAVAEERRAWHDTELSRHTSESLRHEVSAAVRRANDLRRTAPEPAVTRSRPRRLVPAHA